MISAEDLFYHSCLLTPNVGLFLIWGFVQEVHVVVVDMLEDVTSCIVTDLSEPGFSLSSDH